MTLPRVQTRRRGRTSRHDISPNLRAALFGEPLPEPDAAYWPDFDNLLEAAWREHERTILAAWCATYPGTRPPCWWRWSAPRAAAGEITSVVPIDLDAYPSPRRRLGGIGTPCFEVLCFTPLFRAGLPEPWVQPFDLAFYGSSFAGQAIDLDNPPLFESEAEYLNRHGLLSASERRLLDDADFQPVAISG
jgi:hypothetical protein